MVKYRELEENEICRELFGSFIRRQAVTKCRRFENGKWTVKDAPFIDDWSESDYEVLIKCLKETVRTGGFVYAAFENEALKGFAAITPEIFGGEQGYIDLAAIHVSEDMRRRGIGAALFSAAAQWAKKKGARKLYISSHSAVESQAFYQKMGCTEAKVYNQEHVEKEPFDCQLEFVL